MCSVCSVRLSNINVFMKMYCWCWIHRIFTDRRMEEEPAQSWSPVDFTAVLQGVTKGEGRGRRGEDHGSVVLPSPAEVCPRPTTKAVALLRQPHTHVDATEAVCCQAGLSTQRVQWTGTDISRNLPHRSAGRGHRWLLQLGRRVLGVSQMSSEGHQLEPTHLETTGHRSSVAVPHHPHSQVSN